MMKKELKYNITSYGWEHHWPVKWVIIKGERTAAAQKYFDTRREAKNLIKNVVKEATKND